MSNRVVHGRSGRGFIVLSGMGETAQRAPEFLVHNEGDQVAVAVQDVEAGPVRAVYLDSDREVDLEASEAIPLGHKVALDDLDAGADVIEYGVRIGRARTAIRRGALVHTHNLRSARWEASA
jgi:(2R)-sulfolactate sulfo-lyase subunit alpha